MLTIMTSADSRPRSEKRTPPITLPVSNDTLEELGEVFRVLGDRHRLKILMALSRQGPMHVSALTELLDQSQPAVSHHLSEMRKSRLVRCDRRGKHNFYRLDSTRVGVLLDQLFGDMANGGPRQIRFEDLAVTFKKK